MSVWMRRIAAGGVAALLVALLLGVGALIWLATSFDANRYKSTAVDWMRAHHQRTLAIDGPIELSLFPRLVVEVSKLSLSEAGRPQQFAALDEASLAIDVLPLLRGQLVIGGIKARGVRIAYLRDAKGRSNIADFLDKRPAHTGDGHVDAGPRPLRFDVRRIELTDVRARVQDELTGIVGDVMLGHLSTGRLAERTEAPLSFAARFALTAPAAKGELTGEATLLMDLPARSFALKHMRLAMKADTATVSAIDAQLKGTLGWSGTQRALDASGLELLLSANTNSVKLVESSIAIERFGFDPAAKSLSVHQLRARLRGTQGGQPMSLDLDWPALAMTGQRLSGSALTGSLKLGGTTALDASFKSAAPDGSTDALRLPGFEAQIVSGGVTATTGHARKLSGKLRGDLLLRPAQPSLAIDRLELRATLTEDKLSPIALGLRGQALASTQQSTWSVNGELNADPFDSQGQLTLTGPTPFLKASARFAAIDLNRFVPSAPEPAPAKTTPDAADTPVDLSPLRALDGEFSLRAGKLAWQHYRATDLRGAAHLQGGMLRLTEFKGRAWNGDFDATAFADARASRVALKGTASGVDVQALLKDVAAKDLLEGNGRVAFDIDTAGRSVVELKSRLAGSASLQLRDGALKGVNLAKLLRQTRAALSTKPATADTAQKAVQTEKTDFGELSASFRIADGVASSQDLDLKSPFLRLGGEGTLGVASGRLDYTARATLAATAQGQGGAAQAAVKGLTVPVRLTGTLEAPVWTILWTQMAGELLTPEVKDRLKERLKERLKGLLK